MRVFLLILTISFACPLWSAQQNSHKTSSGIVNEPSQYSVEETVKKIESILKSKGITLFALINHSKEAEKAGMKMPPTQLLIFGSPKAGTPLMLASPSIALDLPLKILIWEDSKGKVWLSYNSTEYLKDRHDLPENLLPNIEVVGKLIKLSGVSSNQNDSLKKE